MQDTNHEKPKFHRFKHRILKKDKDLCLIPKANLLYLNAFFLFIHQISVRLSLGWLWPEPVFLCTVSNTILNIERTSSNATWTGWVDNTV